MWKKPDRSGNPAEPKDCCLTGEDSSYSSEAEDDWSTDDWSEKNQAKVSGRGDCPAKTHDDVRANGTPAVVCEDASTSDDAEDSWSSDDWSDQNASGERQEGDVASNQKMGSGAKQARSTGVVTQAKPLAGHDYNTYFDKSRENLEMILEATNRICLKEADSCDHFNLALFSEHMEKNIPKVVLITIFTFHRRSF